MADNTLTSEIPRRSSAPRPVPPTRGDLDVLTERCAALEAEAAEWRVEALNWRQQYLFNQSFLRSLSRSLLWKLLGPVRAVRQLLRPRGFTASALIPWHQLEPDEESGPGAWIATGSRSYFVVPCELPAGWLWIRAGLTSEVPGRLEILASSGHGIWDAEPIWQVDIRGALNRVAHVYVTRPMLGLQINVPGAAARFQIQQLDVAPVPRAAALMRSGRRELNASRPDPVPTSAAVTPTAASLPSNSSAGEYPDLCLVDEPAVAWSIIIPTIHEVERVVKCITTCRQYLEPGITAEWIVVDDGTSDPGIVQQLQQAAVNLDFLLLMNHQNLGFSASVNHGMRYARGRYLALCNNDIVFFKDCLGAFARAFEAHPQVGILGARLLFPTGTLQHVGMDKVPGQLRWHHAFHDYPGHYPPARAGRSVWSVTGALMALRRETLQRLGGFSTAYATGYEDLDYCLHAWTSGVRVRYCPEATAWHEECGTRGALRGQQALRPLFWSERERAGRQYFEKKWAALRAVESFEVLVNESARSCAYQNGQGGCDAPK